MKSAIMMRLMEPRSPLHPVNTTSAHSSPAAARGRGTWGGWVGGRVDPSGPGASGTGTPRAGTRGTHTRTHGRPADPAQAPLRGAPAAPPHPCPPRTHGRALTLFDPFEDGEVEERDAACADEHHEDVDERDGAVGPGLPAQDVHAPARREAGMWGGRGGEGRAGTGTGWVGWLQVGLSWCSSRGWRRQRPEGGQGAAPQASRQHFTLAAPPGAPAAALWPHPCPSTLHPPHHTTLLT